MTSLDIELIQVGERDRADLGNIRELADSIAAVGLLHPVVVTEDGTLVAGDRRLSALRHLGWLEVPVTVVDLSSAEDVLRAESDENTCRKPLTPYEASRARERRAKLLAPKAKENQREHGGTAPGKKNTSSKLDEVKATDRATRKIGAIGTGYSGSTLDKVDKIRDVAERGVIKRGKAEIPAPEPVRQVAREALDGVKETGAAVDGASKKVDRAIEKFIEDDDSIKRARYRASVTKAIAAVGSGLLTFDPARAAECLDDLTGIEELRKSWDGWFKRFDNACTDGQVVQLKRRQG